MSLPRITAGTWLTTGIAAVLCAVAFEGGGGLVLGPTTTVEMGLTLGGGALVAVGALTESGSRRWHGAPAVWLMLALAALTVLSVIWSVSPGDAWPEASRTVSYAVVFAAAAAAARMAPGRWASLVAGVLLSGVIVCAWALLTKIFPGALDPQELYARLRAPYGYWNAVGLTAALAVPSCLWLGARRWGHAAVNALAYPALAILLITLLLAYSRGALLALALGLALWFGAVPLRLRGAAVLLTAVAVSALAVAWAFSAGPLTQDRVDIGLRTQAGHQLGLLIVAVIAVSLVAGLGVGFLADRYPPAPPRRRQIGVALLVALALVPLGLLAGLTVSSRGLTGSVSHAWTSLTDPHARTPPNDPSRLTAVGSVRARYWNQALRIFTDHPGRGVGAGGYATARRRYREDTLDVHHAHGYVVQTLSDLGLAGLAVSLALLIAWLGAALRSCRPWGWWPRLPRASATWGSRLTRRRSAATPHRRPAQALVVEDSPTFSAERIGLLTLLSVTVVFGVHSFVDWTWFVPANASTALLCAGWLAGRGPLTSVPASGPHRLPSGRAWRRDRAALGARARTVGPVRALAAGAVFLSAVVAAWGQWQPLRSAHAGDRALAALESHHLGAAQSNARDGARIDPLSVDPLVNLAVIQVAGADLAGARKTLQSAVILAPSDPQTWLRLADFDLNQRNDPAGALHDLRPALFLDPRGFDVVSEFLAIIRHVGGTASSVVPGQTAPLGRVPAPGGQPVLPVAGATPSPIG